MNDQSQVPGATTGEDLSDLLQLGLASRRARDAAETELIDRAYQQYVYRGRRKKSGSEWLTSDFLRQVHRTMFGEIWTWAGKYRQTELNIGIDWHKIPERVEILCGDFKFWDSEASRMSVLEVAARLQSHLTRIHPFKNGNGRHARFITDIFFRSRRMALPRWPQIHLEKQGDQIRETYLLAMKSADQENYEGLMKFIGDCCPKPSDLIL